MAHPTPFDVDDIWERIERRVTKTDACWLWTGKTNRDGYGMYAWRPDTYLVHRVAYQALVGDIPDGKELDHLCRVRNCCNPQHLEPVTHEENVKRGDSPWAKKARQTHCKRGHEFTPDNIFRKSNGTRECLTCKRNRYRVTA